MKWPTATLADICEEVVDCPHSTPKWTDAGVRVLRSKNIRNGRLDLEAQESFTSEEDYTARTRRAIPRRGDLVITREAPMGEVCMLPDIQCCLGQRMVLLRPSPPRVDSRFLLYALQSRFVQDQIARSKGSGTTVSNLRIPHLEALEIPLPPKAIQDSIGETLGAYDDLIEINSRRMALLEEAIQLLYREWFVYLRFPGHERVKVVDGVPEGWRRATLGDIVTLHYGKSLPQKSRRPGPVPVYGSSGVVGTHSTPLVEGGGIVVGRKGNVGSVFRVNEDFHPIDTVFFVEQDRASTFLYCTLSGMRFTSSDAAVPGLNRNAAYSQKLLVPPRDLIAQYEALVDPMCALQGTLLSQNERLREARDFLLPRLMDGRIAV